MMNFLKISTNFTLIDLQKLNLVLDDQHPSKYYSPDNNDVGLFYYNSNLEIQNIVKDFLPVSVSNQATIDLCKINHGVLPHKDHDCACKINFYIKASDAKTVFFEDSSENGYSYKNNGKNNMYDIKLNRLKRSEMFVAKDGDVYLLNTSKIHSVIMNKSDTRIIVSASFTRTFEEIRNLIA